MTTETREDPVADAADAAERQADEMQEGVDRLGEHIDESRKVHQQAIEDSSVPTGAGDWEDTDDDAGGEDATGFDDPESEDDEDEDDDA